MTQKSVQIWSEGREFVAVMQRFAEMGGHVHFALLVFVAFVAWIRSQSPDRNRRRKPPGVALLPER